MRMLWGAAGLLGLALTVPMAAIAQEDDLAVVKKAVAQATPAPAAPEDAVQKQERAEDKRPAVRKAGKPTWLKVRVLEKGGRKKVNVNLPLALVRAMGDDFDVSWFCGHHRNGRGSHKDRDWDDDDNHCPSIKLADVLAALDSGQDLVQVDDEDSTVRVWVE